MDSTTQPQTQPLPPHPLAPHAQPQTQPLPPHAQPHPLAPHAHPHPHDPQAHPRNPHAPQAPHAERAPLEAITEVVLDGAEAATEVVLDGAEATATEAALSRAEAATESVSEVVLGGAEARGDKPAFVDLGGGAVFTYRALAATVAGVAAGLVRRGARPGQVCAVYADTVSTLFIATHAALAAGAVAAPIPPTTPGPISPTPIPPATPGRISPATTAAGVDDVGEQLCRVEARRLFTTTALAEVAVAAAERSRVREVLCFGPAPDTTDVADVLRKGATSLRLQPPCGAVALLTPHGPVTHDDMRARMAELDAGVRVCESDVVLAAWPLDGGDDGDPAWLLALVGLALARGAVVVTSPRQQDPLDLTGLIDDFGVTVAAVPPAAPALAPTLWRP
ncbi:AMP-binding protein [Streptosporangiaceae bacterium NEAU-GS5]|nr:AMP-binding protein [Streptosporangiaceae bacterium NEAU-GS5]